MSLVVCIDAKNWPESKFDVEKYLVLKNIYTIIDTLKIPNGEIEYRFFEFDKEELWFNSRRFRPIDTPNISLFNEMFNRKVISVPDANDDNPYIKELEEVASY
jgi:hypothetical protein